MIAKNPVHPGSIVREECLAPLGLSVTDAAAHLGVSRQALNNLVNGKAALSPEMAIRLAKAFGSSTRWWMALQAQYDLTLAVQLEPSIRVKRYKAPAAPRRAAKPAAKSPAKSTATKRTAPRRTR